MQQQSLQTELKTNSFNARGKKDKLIMVVTLGAGVVLGVALSYLVASSYIDNRVAAETSRYTNSREISAKAVSDTKDLSCAPPTAEAGRGAGLDAAKVVPVVATAAPVMPVAPAGGRGADDTGAPAPNVITKIIQAHKAAIENTGPDSKNTITQDYSSVTNVTNNNDVSVVNNNTQTATSGDAEVKGNTSGGSATSGEAVNESTTSIYVDIKN